MRKVSTLAVLGALAAACASAQANTIQPLSINGSGSGPYTYNYSVQLTPNNGLIGTAGATQSLVVIFDFPGVTSVSLSSFGSDITAVGDWTVGFTPLGAPAVGVLPGVPAAGLTTVVGSNFGIAPDSGAVDNVYLIYTGAGVAVAGSQRELIHLAVTSSVALQIPPGPPLQSLSRNSSLLTSAQVDSYPVGAVVPLPAAAWAGLSMLGGLGVFGAVRRRRMA